MKPLNTTVEEVLRSAIADEVSSRDFYLNLASKLRDGAAAARARKLADEQLTHRAKLETRYSDLVGHPPPQVQFTTRPLPHDSESIDLSRLLKIALEHEREAESNFRFLAERVPETALGHLFLELAEMEWQHKVEIQNEYNMSLDPEQFLNDM